MVRAWQSFWQIVKDNRMMNLRATMIFVVAIILGALMPLDNALMLETLEQMSELAGELAVGSSVFQMIQLIFVNNITVALMMILLGFIFAIIPFFLLVINGVFIGFFTKFFLNEGGSLFGYLVSLLPHGVFELTAIVLAGAYGFKLGSIVWRGLRGLVTGNKTLSAGDNVVDVLREMTIFIIGILIILLIAAIIESTISLALAEFFN